MVSDTAQQRLFAGQFRHSIDGKNRITIPSRWRRSKADEFILLADEAQRCLLVMSADELDRISTQAEGEPTVPARDRRVFLRQLLSRAQHGVADKQGRLVLPDDLCRTLELKGEVALIGGRGRFEIWNSTRWQRTREDEKSTYQHVANVIGL